MKRNEKSWLLFLMLSVMVSSCNGLNATPMTRTNAQASDHTNIPHGWSLANKEIFVVSEGPPASLSTFPADANGLPMPIRRISGSNTDLVIPWRGAFLDDGSLWVVDQKRSESPGYALRFSSTANGNAHPAELARCLENVDGGTIGLDAQG